MKIPFQTALITGSSRGIGRGIAVKLAREGVKKIAVHYLTRQDEAEKTVAQLRDAGADGVLVQGDTSNANRANVCALLCSEEAGFVTGQTISVDGGSSLMNPDFPLPLQVPA